MIKTNLRDPSAVSLGMQMVGKFCSNFFLLQFKNCVYLASLNMSARLINSLHSLHLTSLNGIQDSLLLLVGNHLKYMNNFSSF